MLIVDGKIVSEALFSNRFQCEISKCKGACCIEGDMGAPLEEAEVETIRDLMPILKPRLPKAGQNALDATGPAVQYKELKGMGTTLREDGACAFVKINERGVATCGIEEAYFEGLTSFRKPISCHLYPIRIEEGPQGIFEALNYDKWDICAPACAAGEKNNIKMYEFARDALIRKYGEAFYGALEVADPTS